jgi:serine/threonine-protein kinase
MDAPARLAGIYCFEKFRLEPISRTLTRDGQRVPIAPRLFDTLLYLVENHARLVPREELMLAVWPARTVEDTSLGMAISSLRTALKQAGATESLIITAPGRGYHFGARVFFEPLPPPEAIREPVAPRPMPRSSRRKWPIVAAAMAVALTAGSLAVWRVSSSSDTLGRESAPPFRPPPHSIAVLPFTNMGGDPKEEYFADGLSEELINALGRGGVLRVAARMSSFSFKGRQVSIAQIARQLNVGLVLEGSIRRDGARIRIIAELIDAATGYQIWAHSFDREQSDILPLQRQLAEAVFSSLKIVLLPNEAARLTLGATANPRALDAYLSGLPYATDVDDAGERRAIAAFNAAIALDPNYALAYAERARALSYLAVNGMFNDVTQSKSMMDAALADANHALALAPDLAEAHAALGFVLKCRLSDLSRAAAEYARALELAPGDASIMLRSGLFELALGHVSAAVDAAEHATALDPLSPRMYRWLAKVLTYAGRYDDALTALRRARSLPPADPDKDRNDRAFVEIVKGDAQAAARTCVGNLDAYDYLCLAWAYYALGKQPAADAELAKLRNALGNNGAYAYAHLYAQWGRQDEALQWLRTAYQLRDPGLIDMRIDPALAPLRRTDTYRSIEQGLGFPG